MSDKHTNQASHISPSVIRKSLQHANIYERIGYGGNVEQLRVLQKKNVELLNLIYSIAGGTIIGTIGLLSSYTLATLIIISILSFLVIFMLLKFRIIKFYYPKNTWKDIVNIALLKHRLKARDHYTVKFKRRTIVYHFYVPAKGKVEHIGASYDPQIDVQQIDVLSMYEVDKDINTSKRIQLTVFVRSKNKTDGYFVDVIPYAVVSDYSVAIMSDEIQVSLHGDNLVENPRYSILRKHLSLKADETALDFSSNYPILDKQK